MLSEENLEMAKINENYLKLPGSYLFSTIAKKVSEFQEANPDREIIRMGIGDVTRPLVPAVIEAMHKAVDEMGTPEGFHGYGPEQGYDFLRNKIVEHDYAELGIEPDEIFVSDYARENGSVILYDSAYEAFITEEDVPHSIYEVEGAKEVAIEFRSFSKTAGFTGTRCAYTVVPKALKIGGTGLNGLWNRRQCTKFNGVPYVIQKAAEAVYSDEGQKQSRANIEYYLGNAGIIRTALEKAGLEVYGGVNSPYVWAKAPNGMKSWDLFDKLLNEAGVVTTPGSGFGPSGEGYIRFTAFSTKENTEKAMEKIAAIL